MDTSELNEKQGNSENDDNEDDECLNDYQKSVEKSDNEKKCVLYM